MKKGKRFLALLLSFAMIVTLLPSQVALAEGGGSSEAGNSLLGSGTPDDGGPLPAELLHFTFENDTKSETEFTDSAENAKAAINGSGVEVNTTDAKIGSGALSLKSSSWLRVTNKDDGKNPLIGKTALTISYWSKVSGGKWAYYIKYKDAQNSEQDLGYIAIMDEKTVVTTQRFPKTTGRGSNGEISKNSLTNNWRKVTVVLEENASTLYLDGKLIGRTDNNNGLSLTETLIDGSIFNIGKATWGGGEYFEGLIDDFIVYDGALNTKQIQTLYYKDDPEAFDAIKTSIKENGFIQSADNRSMGIGETETIQVTDNVPESLVSMITYKSSDNAVASVDASGKITGIAKGTATITASFEDAKKEITVTVKDAKEELTPIGSYTFEDGLDGASAVTGTKNNATWMETYTGDLSYDENGRNGKSIKITNDYGLKLKETNLGDNYTVSMWVKNDSLQGENRSIFFLGASGKWLGLNSNDNNNGGVCKFWGQQSGSSYIYPLGDTITIPNKKWTMLTMTQSGDKVSLYQDGKLIAAKEDVSVFDTMNGKDQIIALGTNPWSYQYDNKLQNSLFDDVHVYDTALDASQVATVYLKDANAESLDILGENESINCITDDLTLPKEANGINLTWTSSVPAKITEEGEVKAQDGSEVTLTVNASVPELDFTWEKEFKVKLAREVTVNYLDVKSNTSIKTEKLYLEEGKEYTYTDIANIPEILATENAAYQYLKDDSDNNKLQITVSAEANSFTIAYRKMSLGQLDALEDITVIEGNAPILPKTVGAVASPDDGTPSTANDETSETTVKINVPITWSKTPDITALKAGEHTITGNAGGKTASVKVNVLECDEDIGTTEAKDGNPVSTYKLGKAYKGHIVAEYDIVVTNIAASNDMSMIYTDLADNNGNWTSASGPRMDFGKGGNNNVPFFRTQKGDGKGNSSGNYPAPAGSYKDEDGYVKAENEKTYRIRMEIDDETNGGLYKTYLTEANGKVTKLFESSGCTFRGYTGNGIQNFMAVRGGFTITNHKIYWESGYATKKIEIYVGDELKETIASKEEAGKFKYEPEDTYEIEGDENIYVLVPEKSGWTKEDGTVDAALTESAETAAGKTATYKAYYVKKANLNGLDTAIKKAEADKTSAEASKVYTDASVTALQEKIDAAKAVQTKYTAEGVTEEKLQEDAVIKEVKDAIDSLTDVLVAKKVDELKSFMEAYYKLNDATEDEDSDANKVTDSSGKGHDGVKSANVQLNRYNGAVLPGGKARENGIRLPNDLEVSDKMTFSFWAYGKGSSNNVFGIGSGTRLRAEGHEQNVGTTAAHHFSIYINGGKVWANGGDFGWEGPTGTENAACAANEWHFITCVVDGTKVNLYVDGQPKTEGNIKVSIPTAWDANEEERFAYIGNNVYSYNGDSDWKGNIKNFRIYTTSLADEQIKEIYDTELNLPMQLAVEDVLKEVGARTEKGEYLLDITGEGTETDISLIAKGKQNETIAWTAYAADGTTESSDVIDVATKKVKLPQTIGEPASAVLKAVITLGEETETITIKCTATKVANLNRAAFNAAIDKADKMNEEKYTATSWNAFVELRTKSRTDANKAATQEALDAITAKLENAMKTDGSTGSVLVLLGDKEELIKSIAKANAAKEGRNEADYTGTYKSAWDTLAAKLTAAENAKESNDVDETAVTLAKNELDSAVTAFVNATLDMKLAAANAAKDGKNESDYAASVWKALTDAIEKAESLKDNAEATQEQKLAACDELEAAITDFVEINKEAADKLKEEAAGKLEAAKANKANYDEDVWNALERAIEDYEKLGADASKADLVAAYNRISVAMANFKPISKENVASLKNEAADMLAEAEANKANYDETIWKALEDAITAAENLKANATQTQITKAYTDLKTAMANFKPKETATVTGVSVTPQALSMKEGGSAALTATVTYSDGTTDHNVTWSSNNTAVATVVNGNVTAVKAGTATITATAGDKSAACTVTVTADTNGGGGTVTPPAANQKVTKVTLNKTKLTLGIKDYFTLKATSAPAEAVSSVTWDVDKKGSKIVTLNKKSGKVTGKKKGKATVTVTVTSKDGSKLTKKCTITVKPAPTKKTKISVKKSITVKAKKATTLKPKVKGNFGCATFKFTSKNKKVAKVDASGKVTGVKKGKTKITVTTYNKKAKVTVNVTVK